MARRWTPQNTIQVMVATTACLCLLVVVFGTILGALQGKVSAEMLGTVSGASAGTGLLGLVLIIANLLHKLLHPRSNP